MPVHYDVPASEKPRNEKKSTKSRGMGKLGEGMLIGAVGRHYGTNNDD
jgi:hypothetical protein